MNAQRKRENALLKRHGFISQGSWDLFFHPIHLHLSREKALSLIVSKAATEALGTLPRAINTPSDSSTNRA